MAILAADLKLRSSERMVDDYSTVLGTGGGGRLGTDVIAGTAENDVFPDVMPADRAAGVTQLRKVWVSPMSASDRDALANAALGVLTRPADANCRVGVFRAEGNDLSHQALARLRVAGGGIQATNVGAHAVTVTAGSATVVAASTTPAVGELVMLSATAAAPFHNNPWASTDFRVVTAVSGQNVTLSGTPSATSFSGYLLRFVRNTATDPGFAAVSVSTDAPSAGASYVTVDRLEEKFDQASSTYGKAGAALLFFAGDSVLVQHGTTSTTREYRTVDRVDYLNSRVYFTSPLSNSYAVGAKVLRMSVAGTAQAAVSLPVFSQQTWQRVWSDTVTTPISAQYSGAITLVNAGAATDRWAIVFTSSTEFYLTSERYGQIATGSTAANFSPLNPYTNLPYFTLASAGWGSGWLAGNCIRFNTVAAAAPVWVSRCTLAGSTAAGTVNAVLQMSGDVGA